MSNKMNEYIFYNLDGKYLDVTLKELGLENKEFFHCDICKEKIIKDNIGGFIHGAKVICDKVECKIATRVLEFEC